MLSQATRRLIDERLSQERGRIDKHAPLRVALAYPSAYAVGMSSLGYQRVYRAIQAMPGTAAERFFLQDGGERPDARLERPVSYEGLRPLDDFQIVAFSVAYENELVGLVRMLEASNIPLLAENRDESAPVVLIGGPLTFSNPLPIAPFADAIVMGEAEGIVEWAIDTLASERSRAKKLAALARHPHVFVPLHHGTALPGIAACDSTLLPAFSAIRTPQAELSDMFLIEPERGCSRGCTYCVMRRSTNGGMRLVPQAALLEAIPAQERRVGLVGAAVSDHPRIVEIVRALAERGCTVGLSSLRPDRLKEEFVEALKLGGYRTLTTALDGASERLRDLIERRGREPHYVLAAERARKYGLEKLKLYLMVGLPGETDDDIDECARFVGELTRIIPVALGIAPFCSKRNTPLDRTPFAGIELVESRLDRLRRGLKGRAQVRATSARWAWIEYVLAQGGAVEGIAAASAVRAGGRFSDFKRAFERLGHRPDGAGYASSSTPLAPERLRRRLAVVPPSVG